MRFAGDLPIDAAANGVVPLLYVLRGCFENSEEVRVNPFRTAVPVLGTDQSNSKYFGPKTGLRS